MEPRDLLKRLMASRGDNPNSLSRKHGLPSQPQIQKFVSGTAREPKLATLKPLAKHYRIPVEALLDADRADQVAAELNLLEIGDVASPPSEGEPSRATVVAMEGERIDYMLITATQCIAVQLKAADEMTREAAAPLLARLAVHPDEATAIAETLARLFQHPPPAKPLPPPAASPPTTSLPGKLISSEGTAGKRVHATTTTRRRSR